MKNSWSSEKHYSKQMAASYIMYMMVGSYYHRCICRSPLAEQHMYLHYAEMPVQKQFSLEEKTLRAIERLDREVKSVMQELNCEVRFRWDDDDYVIVFDTMGFGNLEVRIESDGRFTLQIQG